MNQPAPQAAGNGTPSAAGEPVAPKRASSSPWARRLTMALLVVLSGAFFLYLLVPVIALLFHAPPQEIWAQMKEPDVLKAVQLSLVTTAIATVLAFVFGLPAAIGLARGNLPGSRILGTIATNPTVLPPAVARLALLLTYGRMGLIGKHLTVFGISIPFTTTAVVMAQIFVAAPFFVNG